MRSIPDALRKEPDAFLDPHAHAMSERPAPIDAAAADQGPAPTYSVRLLQPFLGILRSKDGIPSEWFEAIDELDLDFRLPVEVANQMLDAAVAATGDPNLGLEAAQAWTPGNAGAVDYVINSASTVRLAIDAAARYMSLVNDALDVRLEIVGNEAHVKLENRVPMSRAARDFQVGSIYHALWSVWASGSRPRVRVLFTHAAPGDTAEYEETFPEVPVEFGAPFSGFVFDAQHLDTRLVSAETELHQVILGHAEKMLQDLPSANQLTDRVRNAIASELAGGNPSITEIARRFHMSPRTLERRLEREGTTYSVLLDDLRKRLALRYVVSQDLELAEIAFLLGFSQTTGFHRAFKRWTGQTPLDYRRAHRPVVGRR